MANEPYYLASDYFTDITPADIAVVNNAGADKEDANYPKENSQHADAGKTSRSDDKTNIKIRFDINSASGGTKPLKAFALINHNLSGGSIKYYSYTANDYATNQVLEATTAVRALDMYTRISSPTDRRYWELDISHNGNATSTASYYEWGRLICYDDFTILTEIENYEKVRGYQFRNIIHETKSGVRWAYKIYEKRERFGLDWSVRTQANMPAELRTLYEAVNADADPFIFIPDIASTNCYYGYLENPNIEYLEVFGTSSDDLVAGLRLYFIEAIRGKV